MHLAGVPQPVRHARQTAQARRSPLAARLPPTGRRALGTQSCQAASLLLARPARRPDFSQAAQQESRQQEARQREARQGEACEQEAHQ